ncbi:MAG: WD40/YVTN/BNR-like repeat-containing protein, partial [Longimicrobiales bacterium]
MSRNRPAPVRRIGLAVACPAVCLAISAPAAGPLSGQARIDPALFADLEYRSIGPSRGGRVTAVEGVPQQRGLYYMGATGGGVWVTEDYGHTWTNISDGFFHTGSIGAIEVADSDPDVIYVGTGSDGIRSNVITGRGIYKSTDAGETWARLGLEDVGQIAAVEAHPRNADLVFAAAQGHPFGPNPERGVYRSTDGGRTWENVLFVADSIGASDIEFHPTNPRILYAGMWRNERKPWTIISGARLESGDGIWVSRDGGDTWTHIIENMPDPIGKIDFAVSADDPDRVYALIEADAAVEGLYRSDDAGATWRLVSNRDGLMDRPFYYTNVTADPSDADVLYVGATSWWKSTDGGETWDRRPTPHGDNHDLWIDRQ